MNFGNIYLHPYFIQKYHLFSRFKKFMCMSSLACRELSLSFVLALAFGLVNYTCLEFIISG